MHHSFILECRNSSVTLQTHNSTLYMDTPKVRVPTRHSTWTHPGRSRSRGPRIHTPFPDRSNRGYAVLANAPGTPRWTSPTCTCDTGGIRLSADNRLNALRNPNIFHPSHLKKPTWRTTIPKDSQFAMKISYQDTFRAQSVTNNTRDADADV